MEAEQVLQYVDELFVCPVVGMCLSAVEQRCLLKKAGVKPDGLSRYDVHEMLVSAAGSDTPLARHMGRLLASRYEGRAAPLRALPEEDFVRVWQAAFAGGEYRAELWAAATRSLSDGARRTLYGQLHMGMHGMAGEQIALRAELDGLRKKLGRQERKEAALRTERDALRVEVEQLRRERAHLEKEQERSRSLAPEAREAEERDGVRTKVVLAEENARLREELRAAESLLSEQEGIQARLEARLADLEARLLAFPTAQWQEEEADRPSCDAAHCNETCPSFDLCRKRVLIVGGIERMESRYRQLVEGQGGILEYHAGHMRGGKKQLEQSLQRADVVLCPVNCNSHGACVLVKNLAKKYRKPVHMMANFSLSAVAGVISAHAGEQVQ